MAEIAEALMIHDLPTFAVLRDRMKFLQTRQRVLAQNVANADTPGFKPRDIRELGVDPASRGSDQARRLVAAGGVPAAMGLAATDPQHLGPVAGSASETDRGATYETRPSGNSVDLENEMLKVSQNQIDFQTAANIYQRGLATLKTALGRRA
jgi:flagellar basal-body rod protein FlgB